MSHQARAAVSLAAVVLLAGGVAARSAPGAAAFSSAQGTNGTSQFWVCTWRVRGTDYYVSEVFASRLGASDLIGPFRRAVAAKYKLPADVGGAASCDARPSEAAARALRAQDLTSPPGLYKAVDTAWTYSAQAPEATAPSSSAPATSAAAAEPYNPHGASASLPPPRTTAAPSPSASVDRLPMFCSVASNTTAYITKVFMSPMAAGTQGQVADQFNEFIRKTYGDTVRGASCPAERADDAAAVAASEKGRDNTLDTYHGAKLKVVELDWAPVVSKTEMPAKPPAQAAPSATVPVAAAAPATPAPAGPKPRPTVQEKFAYCHADGGLPREASHRYYVSSTVVVPPGVSPDTAFGAFLRSAYPKEIVNGVRCSYPQAQNFTETARLEDLKSHRGAPQIEVVEVNWKGPAGGS